MSAFLWDVLAWVGVWHIYYTAAEAYRAHRVTYILKDGER